MTLNTYSRAKRLPTYLLLFGTFIVLFGMLLRFPNLLELPLYVDEAQHIYRSQRIGVGEVFQGVDQNKWLFSLAAGAFFARGAETIFIARAVSVLCSAVTIATCVALGKALLNKWAGLLAGLFYAVVPFGVFHERQALVDPMLTMFTTLVIALSLLLARKPRWWVGLLLMLSLAGAYLTKTAGLPYYVMPFIALVVYLRFDEYGWLLKSVRGLGYAVAAVALSLGMRAFFYGQSALAGIEPRDTHTAGLENTVFGMWSDPDVQTRFYRDLGLLLELILRYAGPIILVFSLLGLYWLFKSNRQSALLYIMAPALGLLWVPMLASRPTFWSFPSRYFMTSGPPLAILAAISILILLPRLHRSRVWVVSVAAALVVVQGVVFTLFAASNPDSFLLGWEERPVYSHEDRLHRIVGQAVVEQWDNGTAEHAHIIYHGVTHQLISVHIGNHIGIGFSSWDHPRQLREGLMARVVAGDDVYLVERVGWTFPFDISKVPYMRYVELIEEYEHPLVEQSARLYRVTGFEASIADAAYRERVPDPDKLAEDAQALMNTVNTLSQRQVIIFPVSQTQPMVDASNHPVDPLDLEVYPPQPDEVAKEFGLLDLGDEGEPFEVILVEESQVDVERVIPVYLQQNYYYAGDEWYNLHHRMTFYTGPANPTTESIQARFEGNIQLTEAAILDQQVEDVLRLMLVWETPAPIGDAFNIFVHLVDADGTIIAQYDRQPGNDLLPMTEWQPNTPITDRIAIPLSADAPAGVYAIHVGIYMPGTGLRLPVIDASEQGGDYIVLGRVEVP